MKKLYVFGVLLSAMNSNAQTVIYSQPTAGTSGIVANALANGNFVASADDFTLASQSTITKINIQGFQQSGTLGTAVATGAMLYIYADNAGKPAGIPNNPAVTPIAKIDIASGAAGYSLVNTATNYTFTIDVAAALPTPLVLQANTVYWLVFAAKTNLTAHTAAVRFNWFGATPTGNTSKLVDPSNAFGASATTWTNISTLTGSAALDGLSFSIEGPSLGVDKEIFNSAKLSVYPNPVKDIVTISNELNYSLQSINITDLNGRTVKTLKMNGEASAQVNISDLSSGVYMMNISSDKGSMTKKIVKS